MEIKEYVLQALEDGELEPIFEAGLEAVELLLDVRDYNQAANILLQHLALLANLAPDELATLYDDPTGDYVAEYAQVLLALADDAPLEVTTRLVVPLVRAFHFDKVVTQTQMSLVPAQDYHIASKAQAILNQISDVGVRDKLCRLVIEGEALYGLVNGYTPSEPYQKALFLFLTDQYDEYTKLDFDHSLLRAVYQTETYDIRKRITAKIRELGHIELLEVFKEQQDWQLRFEILSTNQSWAKLWEFVMVAPPRYARLALQTLEKSGYKPSDQAVLLNLIGLAKKCEGELPPFGTLLSCTSSFKTHSDEIDELIASADGKLLASIDTQGQCFVWAVPTGELLFELEFGRIHKAAFSPDSQYLVIFGALDPNEAGRFVHRLVVFESQTGTRLKTTSFQFPFKAIEFYFLSDNKLLTRESNYIRSDDDNLNDVVIESNSPQVWSLPELKLLHTLKNPLYNKVPAVSPIAGMLAGITEGQLFFWELYTGKLLHQIRANPANQLAFSSDGTILAARTKSDLILYSSRGFLLKHFANLTVADAALVAFSSDSVLLAVTNDEGVTLINTTTFAILHQYKLDNNKAVNKLVFSDDGAMLMITKWHYTSIWSVATGEKLYTLDDTHNKIIYNLLAYLGKLFLATHDISSTKIWTSRLVNYANTPLTQITLKDFLWLQKIHSPNESEQAWVKFIVTLLSYKWQYEVEISNTPVVDVRRFDIELGE